MSISNKIKSNHIKFPLYFIKKYFIMIFILIFYNMNVNYSLADEQKNQIKPVNVLVGHDGPLTGAVYSSDGTRILTASADGTSRIWDATTGELLVIFPGHDGAVTSANFSRDGKFVVTSSEDKLVRLLDAKTGDRLNIFAGHTGWIFNASFSPDGKKIVSASADGTVRVWDILSGRTLILIPVRDGWAMSANFSGDNDKVIVGVQNGSVKVYNLMGNVLRTFAGHHGMINGAALSRDGTRIVTATADNSARIWDLRSGDLRMAFHGHEGWVNSAAFSFDGTMIVTASQDKTARLWDVRSGKIIASLVGHERRLLGAAFSPDGLRVVTASADGTARIWPVDLTSETRQDNLFSFFETSAITMKKPRDIFFNALKAEALGKKNEARALYKDIIDRFKDDEYALKATERLLATAP
jgi:WD40 repeat protein